MRARAPFACTCLTALALTIAQRFILLSMTAATLSIGQAHAARQAARGVVWQAPQKDDRDGGRTSYLRRHLCQFMDLHLFPYKFLLCTHSHAF